MSADPRLDEAEQLHAEADQLYEQGRFRDAVPIAQRCLALREQALGPHHLLVAMTCNDLGLLHARLGDAAAAEAMYLRALEIREQLSGPSSTDVASTLNNLASLYRDRGEYSKAEPLFRAALEIVERILARVQELVATTTDNLGQLYERQGAYSKAEPLHVRAIELFQQAHGAAADDLAACWNNLGVVQRAQARYREAEASFTRALEICEAAQGPKHPDVALSLNNLAALYQELGRPREAEPMLVRALDVRRAALGAEHRDIAQSLNNLGSLYQLLGAYAQAAPLYEQARAMFERTAGPDSADVATCLGNLAQLHHERGELSTAVPLMVRAVDILEQALGPHHPDLAGALNNLGTLYEAQADHARAEPLFRRALGIAEDKLGPRHPMVAGTLVQLSRLHMHDAMHARAERLLVRALDIEQQALGANHPGVAHTLNELARLYREQGADAKAEPLARRSLEILEQALGPAHPNLAPSLHHLTEVLRERGMYAEAEAHAKRAVAVVEQALGPDHLGVATALNNLALVHLSQRAYEQAAPLLTRALEIDERALGPVHPDLVPALQNLASLHRVRREYDPAEQLLRRALAIREQALTPTHPALADLLIGLSMLHHVRRDPAPAVAFAARAAEIREHQLRVELASLPEPRKRALMALLRGETQGLMSLHADAAPDSAPAMALAVTTVLRRKGRILDSLVDSEAAVRAHLPAERRPDLDRLVAARVELTRRYTAHGPRTSPDPVELATLRARIDDLEASLFADGAELRAHAEPATIAGVQAALPPGAALVELVRYRRFDPERPPPHWQDERYLAYLVPASGPIQWLVLETAAEIDDRLDAALTALQGGLALDTTRAALRRLDAAVLEPVRARLPDITHLIVAPDGRLNQVPFEALVDPDGRYAIEHCLISYVTTGRDLLRLGTAAAPRSPAAILADPDYGPPSLASAAAFAPLAHAAGEAADLQPYFARRAMTGTAATKQALIELSGPAVLHVATHGFYARRLAAPAAQDAPASTPASTPASAPASRLAQPSHRDIETGYGDSDLAAAADDPVDALERAGLALASANVGADGILTARQIAHLDWAGTQLVVLSACETGVGAVQAGDGVYGLRRALVLAGAASQVVSLWCVGDASTRALMRDYYAGLARGDGRAEALRQAQLRMLRDPDQVYAHPHFWAAFIAAGDWRPLAPGTLAPLQLSRSGSGP